MTTLTKRFLFWSPRVLCILFAMFLSIFVLDVFTQGYGFVETVRALLIHLIPTYIVIFSLAVAWRWEWVGAVLFFACGIMYLVASNGEGWIISVPAFVLGILFLLNWIYRARLKTR